MNLPRPTMPRFWRRRARPVEQALVIDPADMGTCYGLEMSLHAPAALPDGARPRAGDGPAWWERAEVRKSCGA
jgi:hypothetical protein